MGLKILVVDDSALIRKAIIRAMKHSGMVVEAVEQASDGYEALTAMRRGGVDLVLSDINMPRMDGLQMLAAMQRETALHTIPVIMITTEGSQAKVIEAAKLGARGLIRKPFLPEHVRQKITECLRTEA